MAEHALGVINGKQGRIAFFNFLISVTDECDCMNKKNMPIIVDDIGILASTDPVAIDKAAIDMVEKAGGNTMAKLIGRKELNPYYQIKHAERIGLGTPYYELVELD